MNTTTRCTIGQMEQIAELTGEAMTNNPYTYEELQAIYARHCSGDWELIPVSDKLHATKYHAKSDTFKTKAMDTKAMALAELICRKVYLKKSF